MVMIMIIIMRMIVIIIMITMMIILRMTKMISSKSAIIENFAVKQLLL